MGDVGRRRRPLPRVLGAVALLAGLLAVAPPPTPVAAEPAPTSTCATTTALQPNASGPDVACLQFLLGLGGYYAGELTSHYDQATRAAVVAYQNAHPPLSASGIADQGTLVAMGIYTAPAQLAAKADTCTVDANLPTGA